MTAPYLPKPEPDRLTLAARECWHTASEAAVRAIIAREVAAAEPSDEAIERAISIICTNSFRDYDHIRAALRGEGA